MNRKNAGLRAEKEGALTSIVQLKDGKWQERQETDTSYSRYLRQL